MPPNPKIVSDASLEPGHPGRRDAMPTLLACAVFCVVSCACVACYQLGRSRTTAYPIRVFAKRRAIMDNYVNQVVAGSIRTRADGRGYLIPPTLFRDGVTQITAAEDCVVFYFASLPPDPIEEVVWSPHGYRGLPLRLDAAGHNTLHDLLTLDDEWFYVQRN